MVSADPSTSLLDAALGYAARGWPVFPCAPRTKRPLVARDKGADGKPVKGSGGVSKATVDPDQIRDWWTKWPRAMIGIAVGRGDMLVVDFDPRVAETADPDTGDVTRREWTLPELKGELEAMMGCPLPVSLAVRTPSGGVHVYFRMPPGDPIGNRGNLPQHVDVRGLGGYVVAPPSFYEGSDYSGPYRWLRGDADAAIVDAPEALVAILRSSPTRSATPSEPVRYVAPSIVDGDDARRRYALRALDAEAAELASTPKGGGRHGGRNQGAYWAAFNMGQLVGAGALHEGEVRQTLLAIVRGFDPHAYDAHAAAIENGLANGTAKPRDLGAIGAGPTHGRDSGRSADTSDRPAPPPDAYDDFARLDGPAPDGGDDHSPPFQSGSGASSSASRGSGGRIRAAPDPETDRECAMFAMTDLGNAERLRRRYGHLFRFCKELGWFVWDDRRWELLSEERDKVPGEVMQAVFATVRAIRNEADLVAASGLREEDEGDESRLDHIVRWRGQGDSKTPVFYSDMLRDHAKSSEGAQRLGCVGNLAKSFADIAIGSDAMDREPLAINVLNGTLRLVRVDGRWRVRLDPHAREDLISKVANVIYDPAAACAEFDRFLETVQPDESNRRFLMQWHGLSLTGDTSEQKLAFYHGKGRNGKSTLVDVCSHVAGDYGGSIAIESFLDQGRGRKGGEATPDLARLPGIRFLRTSEPEKGAKLAEALIKLITGGEQIDARHLNKGFFSFVPAFKVTISGNHRPKISGHDDGIWRRVMLVPWAVQIAKEDVDRDLPVKLRAEASGILNRLIEGLLDWREHGLVEPQDVLDATRRYREDSDQLGRFLDECVEERDGARAKSSQLYALFVAWSKANGAGEWQQMGFTKAMKDRGFDTKASNGMQWLGIEMIKSETDFADASSGDDREPPEDRWRDMPV